MYCLYVLKSKKDHNLYIGSTNNLKKRIDMHNAGEVKSTAGRTPFELVYCKIYKAEKDARVREHNLKLRSKAFTQLKKRLKFSIS